jgi:tetratricopeptide (TPR) repeat protein
MLNNMQKQVVDAVQRTETATKNAVNETNSVRKEAKNDIDSFKKERRSIAMLTVKQQIRDLSLRIEDVTLFRIPEMTNKLDEIDEIIKRLREITSSVFEDHNSEDNKMLKDISSIVEAMRLYGKEDYEASIKILNILSEENINKHRIMGAAYAILYHKTGKDPEKENDARRYLDNSEQHFKTYNRLAKSHDKKDKIGRANLASLYFIKKDYANAKKILEELMDDYPEEGGFHFTYGRIHIREGDCVNALEEFKVAERMNTFYHASAQKELAEEVLPDIGETCSDQKQMFSVFLKKRKT